jgi:HlyB family type I secretion system ABC transporter
VDLERSDLRLVPGSPLPTPADLAGWARGSGLWAKADHVKWRHLMRIQSDQPVVVLFVDGSAAIMTSRDHGRNLIFLRDPRGPLSDLPTAVDELRMSQLWAGEVILVRPERGGAPEDEPFDFGWIFRLVLTEKGILRELSIASIVLSVISVIPSLLVMTVIDKVLAHDSLNTLYFVSMMMGTMWLFEAILTYGRHNLAATLGARLDTRLNLHMFNRLLALPLDYYEQNPAGQTTYRVGQIYRVRNFITGTLLDAGLDFFTLFIVLPILFYLEPVLVWWILGAAICIALIIFVYLRPLRRMFGKVVAADVEKSSIMIETVHGIRTVKSLALEPQQRDVWDAKTANAAKLRLEANHLAAWPNALVVPLQRFTERGVLLLGGYFAIEDPTQVSVGALVAIMILGGKVAGPLVNAARVMQDMEEIRSSVVQIGWVLNAPQEVTSKSRGMRPVFQGAITFDNLTFTYPGTKTPALNKLTAEIPAGTMMGLVGRSGSGKSTVARLLQGISRDYDGYMKFDGIEMREIQLSHLRRSFGVVLQDNFLFRGSIRDNIIASRPGLTLEDVVRASRLAGAEEFIERMPRGYETYIEEGSPNLSGGQKQRLAIARSLISDPRLMILDEATSALDPESEALVNANLRRIAHGRTMVIVSHRLASLIDCDMTMVLERGTIVDLAPHAVLLERCTIYRTLWHQQNRHLDASHSPKPTEIGPALVQGD